MSRLMWGAPLALVVSIALGACSNVETGENAEVIKITQIVPQQGPMQGGITIKILGVGFKAEGLTVTFGTAVSTQTKLLADGSIEVLLPGRSTSGKVDVLVTMNEGSVTAKEGFEYLAQAALSVSSIDPTCGPETGGTPVTIRGTGFKDSAGNKAEVYIGGQLASVVTVVDDTTITASTPAGAGGTVDVRVVNTNGTAQLTGAYKFAGFCDAGQVMTLGSYMEMAHVTQAGETPTMDGYAIFFPPSQVTFPSPGTCLLNPPAGISTLIDAGRDVTVSMSGGDRFTMPRQIQGAVTAYQTGSLSSYYFPWSESADIQVAGSTKVAAFSVTNVTRAPDGAFGALGNMLSWENGVYGFGGDADFNIAWSDSMNANGWAIDPMAGGIISNPTDHVTIILAAQDPMSGQSTMLVCSAPDNGLFCIRGGGAQDMCQTPGYTMADLWRASGADQLGLLQGQVIISRTNRGVFKMSGGTDGLLDMSVTNATSLMIVTL